MNSLSVLAVIPARYASSRFPGKPLVDIAGKTMIQRVYEQAKQAFDSVVVATDDKRIFDTVENFGGITVMTSNLHQSGTDRCAEALELISIQQNKHFDIVVNIQGDEPFIAPEQLKLLAGCFAQPQTQIATLVKTIKTESELFNANTPKVVLKTDGHAVYFSRSVVPYLRNVEPREWLSQHTFYKHIGIYAYRTSVIKQITKLKQGVLEKAESLEQLRWIENGYSIMTAITEFETYAIDTPNDLQEVNRKIASGEIKLNSNN